MKPLNSEEGLTTLAASLTLVDMNSLMALRQAVSAAFSRSVGKCLVRGLVLSAELLWDRCACRIKTLDYDQTMPKA